METRSRNRHLDQVMPVAAVLDGGVIVSRRGNVTVGWEIALPQAYTQLESEYDDMLSSLASAVKTLPQWTFVHRQDIYLKKRYEPVHDGGFLHDRYEDNFEGRMYMVHRQYLYLTQSSRELALRGGRASGLFGLRFSGGFPDAATLRQFGNKADEFASVLTGSGRIEARRLTREDLEGTPERAGLIQEYLMLGDGGPVLSDIEEHPDRMRVHDTDILAFSISESDDMPGEVSSTVRVEQLSGAASEVHLSYGSAIGMQLDCEHIVNQFILVPPQQYVLGELDKKRKKMSSGSSNAENRVNCEEITKYIDAFHRDALTSVYTHTSVLAWDRGGDTEGVAGKVSAALSSGMGITAVRDLIDVPVLWYAGIPGAASEIGRDNLMLMELNSALCLGAFETYEKDFEGGMFRICDRLRNVPITVDTQKLARDAGLIDNYNAFVLGPSGTGKSFLMNFYLRNCYDAGESVFIIDVGDSYEGLCALINEQSGGRDGHYHSWDREHPFSFNPFIGYGEWLDADGRLQQDSNSLNFFLSFLQTAWSPQAGWTAENISILTNIVTRFVRKLLSDGAANPVFDDFFAFVRDYVLPKVRYRPKGSDEDEREEDDRKYGYWVNGVRVKMQKFDIEDFILALSSYAAGGSFDFLLNEREPKDLFSSRFVVFEVDKLSQVNDAKFYSLCVLCIMNAFDAKMRGSQDFKVMVIEEAWKAIANETMAPYLAGLWKTSRKFQCSAMVVTQQITDIMSSAVIRDTILQNSAVKFLLDQSNNQNNFGQLQELLGLSDRQRNLILSINRNINPAYRYREVFISWGDRKSGVYATEASWAEALAFESDKVRKKPLYDLARTTGSIRSAIEAMTSGKRR